jgi:hypothetical protein
MKRPALKLTSSTSYETSLNRRPSRTIKRSGRKCSRGFGEIYQLEHVLL